MKLWDLIRLVNFDDVSEALKKQYDYEDTDGYEYVFCKLFDMEPVTPKDNMRIIVEWIEPDERFNESGYWRVDGKCGKLYKDEEPPEHLEGCNDDFLNSEVGYALDFTPWNEWLGMEIDEISFQKLTKDEVCARILWEMTFHGFDEEPIQERSKELLDMVEDIKLGKSKGTVVDIDELKKLLDETLDDEE